MLFLSVLMCNPAYAEVRARVDRTILTDNETIELTIEVDDSSAEPNLKPLQQDFEILSTSRNSRVQIARGKVESRNELSFTLAPRRTGMVHIPALDVGGERTEPITLKVISGAQGKSAADLFIDVVLEPRALYVQQQAIYTIRLFHALDLRDGKLTLPTLPDAIVEKLGDDATREEVRDGRRYNVVERRYAVFPQKPGTLTLPAVTFNGQAVARPARGAGDPFSAMFAQTRPVRALSKEVSMQVNPPPSNLASFWWLPAQRVTLSEAWTPEPVKFRAGEPVTRVLTIEAEGLTAQQLPDITLADTPGVKNYADQPERETRAAGVEVIGRKIQRVAYVATRPGEYTLPPVELQWWDVRANRVQVATLPARTIHVEPAPDAATTADPMPVPNPAPVSVAPAAEPTTATVSAPDSGGMFVWMIAAIVAGVAWVVTLALWWRTRRARGQAGHRSDTGPTSLRAERNAVRDACKRADAAALRDALLRYAQLRWPEQPPRSLGELVQRVESEEHRAALSAVERSLYMQTEGASSAVADAAKTIEAWMAQEIKTGDTPAPTGALQPLYPG